MSYVAYVKYHFIKPDGAPLRHVPSHVHACISRERWPELTVIGAAFLWMDPGQDSSQDWNTELPGKKGKSANVGCKYSLNK